MQFHLRTLLIILALGPPALAGTWWLYTHPVAVWAFAIAALIVFIPNLILAVFGYGFGGLCHLIGRLPGGNDRKAQ